MTCLLLAVVTSDDVGCRHFSQASGRRGSCLAQAEAGATTADAPPAVLDLASLTRRLRETHAIGLLTKLTLKNQVDALLGQLRTFHEDPNGSPLTLAQLRERYDLLLLKVQSLLQDGDPSLARDLRASREPLWAVLADPEKFAHL